jgi:N-acetylglucosaminyldiphosphoundecaprenol N-acetyl-beta-D-mannosaminyltransferase
MRKKFIAHAKERSNTAMSYTAKIKQNNKYNVDSAGQSNIVKLMGVPVSAVTMEQTLDAIDNAISCRKNLHIGVVNAAKIVNMKRNPSLGDDVLSSDIILADGASIVWASKVLKRPLPERVTGIDLMYGMFKRGNEKAYRVYCLGATEEVSSLVAERLAVDYPNVQLVGRQNGYFSEQDEAGIVQDIVNAKPDILLVAITSPKKERFMAKWSDTMNVPIVHGVGGSFDVMSGKVSRASTLWQKLGLEWLYRVKQEPRRLWKRYLVTNTWFCWLLFKAALQQTLWTLTSSDKLPSA